MNELTVSRAFVFAVLANVIGAAIAFLIVEHLRRRGVRP